MQTVDLVNCCVCIFRESILFYFFCEYLCHLCVWCLCMCMQVHTPMHVNTVARRSCKASRPAIAHISLRQGLLTNLAISWWPASPVIPSLLPTVLWLQTCIVMAGSLLCSCWGSEFSPPCCATNVPSHRVISPAPV